MTSPPLPGERVALPASSPELVFMGTVTVVLVLDLARAGTARRLRVSAAVVRLGAWLLLLGHVQG